MLELGGVANLRAGLGQFALVELRELGLTITIPSLPSIKSCFCLNMFLVA